MQFTLARVAFLAVAVLGVAGALLGPPRGVVEKRVPAPRDVFAAGKHRGVCYAHSMRGGQGYGSPDSAASLRALRSMDVSWISLTPFGFQRTNEATDIRWGGQRVAESDDRVRGAAAQARALGIKVMLKPHIWLRPPAWPGSINPGTDAGWAAWFASYRPFILHYATLAESEGMDAFCIGNELQHASLRDREWRSLIAEIRGVYKGAITYGATAEEVTGVPFWDAVDFIGVSAYFVLTPEQTPTPAALAAGWRPVSDRLRALSARHGKKVVFTEIGYRSADFAAFRHWEITDAAPVNLQAQTNAYAAFFETVWDEGWMGGAYFWKWFSHPGHSGRDSNDFEFEGKPAEDVVAAAYGAAARGGNVRGAARAAASGGTARPRSSATPSVR